MHEKEKIGNFELNYQFYTGQDYYSDGDIEDELLRLCKEGYTDEEIKSRQSWPILYHLSGIRENLLEWYPFEREATLLEIGAGCGALTGLLCEKVKKVVAIDLSKRRSQINAYKNNNRGCAEIIVGNFQDIKIEERFDYVTMIGVLEYSASYIQDAKPFDSMLLKSCGYLKTGGKMIIAIENKMGLKYFAGAAEDHTGHPYDGVNGYTKEHHVMTFSKNELTQLLERNGLDNIQFFYPVPDYKFPAVIFSDDYLPRKGEIRGVTKAFSGTNFKMFDEEKVYDTLCTDGLFPYFANSFLVVAERV